MRNNRLENKLIKVRFRFEPTIEDEQNYDLLTKNIWKVNKEKTFEQFVEKSKKKTLKN